MNEIKHLLTQHTNNKKLDLSNRYNKMLIKENQWFPQYFQRIREIHLFRRGFNCIIKLDLNGNDLTYLPDNLSYLVNLRVLDISNNLLENVYGQ